ncbi:DsbE family thiol:disulfide interchange protein [Nitratireductor aquimarinus]|uniref:DsbE family thiol:disulfide interchange protein n=1 Tax=Alphaproteobacteria TaxID=28211 RepID=UPI000DDDD813|nr:MULTISPECIES: DsbE family thiol:disulfide interchange protein [Alphaproteobacteria]MBY6021992.1 DsbE family thiol:disulfide interchange protein [Nitratireductor sp. DP7N14-4]MBN7757205.1 DsbE family thiol:disulfide interchange protein [Nitratireductor aquimarinus]MBN8245073.1 DsbE family thiol:disulfide interchange protein [Nitratireductor aquimarinus]MBY5999965.1 DsbE family thiol:disulfide interchange protein [Tritonibacter mobilis]MBY6133313.1 DsbE family thiol:disulfide interchange prot
MSVTGEKSNRSRRLLFLLPLLVFLALAAVFLMQLFSGRDTSLVPSALIGRDAPQTDLPPLEGMSLPGLSSNAFAGKITLVNVWGSWCLPCRQEHPLLMELARDGRFVIAGLNYKDKPENARRFLGDLGNPYDAIGVDQNGRAAIDWGVYGVPETFLVGPEGRIRYKHVGPFTPESVQNDLMPEIEKLLAERPAG